LKTGKKTVPALRTHGAGKESTGRRDKSIRKKKEEPIEKGTGQKKKKKKTLSSFEGVVPLEGGEKTSEGKWEEPKKGGGEGQ